MTRFTVPASLDEAITALEGLGALLTATEWERAAIVYAFSAESGQGRRNDLTSVESPKLTPIQFAALGIAGLKSDRTVRDYRKRWQQAVEDGDAAPVTAGETIDLPDLPWEPTGHTSGSVSKQIHDMPEDGRVELAKQILSELPTDKAVEAIEASVPPGVREFLPPPSPPDDHEDDYDPLSPDDRERVRQAELAARERELAEQQDKDEILGSMEILSDVAHYRDRGDRLLGEWEHRRVRLTPTEKEAFFAELAGLQQVVDRLRLLAEGKESPEDELQRLVEEHK